MAYSKVGISIPNVTGAIKIVVSTVTKTVENLFDASKATLNKRFTTSSETSENGAYITGYIGAVPGDVIYVKPAVLDPDNLVQKVNCYNDTSDAKIGAKVLSNAGGASNAIFTVSNGVGYFTVPDVSGTTRIKICLQYNTTKTTITAGDLASVVVTKNEPIT